MISFILPDRSGEGELTLADGKISWEAEVPAETAGASVTLIRPDGEKETVRLEKITDNRFEGETDTSLAGAYAARIETEDGSGRVISSTSGGAVVSWTAEYDQRQEDTGALETLVRETGGKVCENIEELLDFRDTAARKRTDLTALLAGLALLLFLFDVAQRRLDLFREPLKRETEETVKPVKEKKQRPKKKEPEKETPAAADVLWEQMKNKKKL